MDPRRKKDAKTTFHTHRSGFFVAFVPYNCVSANVKTHLLGMDSCLRIFFARVHTYYRYGQYFSPKPLYVFGVGFQHQIEDAKIGHKTTAQGGTTETNTKRKVPMR